MERAMIDEAEIWFTTQVAEYLKTPATTIRWWRHIGQGPKSGNDTLIWPHRDGLIWPRPRHSGAVMTV